MGCSGDDTLAQTPSEGDAAVDGVAPTTDASGDVATPIDSGHPDTGTDSGKDSGTDSATDAGAVDAHDAATGPTASFATTPLALGAGNCGGAAVTKTLSISNTGGSPLTVAASTGGGAFSVSPSSLTVAPGGSGTLTVSATVPASSTAGTALSGTLTLTTNDPTHASSGIALSVTPTGATLAWAAGSPTSAAFGTRPVNQTSTLGLTLANTGNAPAQVAFAAPGGTFTLSPTSATIAGGANAALTAGFHPTNTTAQNGTSSFTVTGAVCGTSVSSLAFSGQGATGNVTGWPTAKVDFGANQCGGAAATAQTFTLSNSGGVDAHITGITFGGYAGYTTNATTGSTIPAGGSLTVSLSAPAVPFPSPIPGNYDATVTFTTDQLGDTPHQVNLTEAAKGAIIAFDTSATPGFGNFGQVPVGTASTQNFAIVNTGNADSSVTVADTTPFSVGTATFNVAGGSNQSNQAMFTPTTYGTFSSQLAVTATNLCQPAPASLPLSGVGQSGGIAITNTPAPFTVNCGGSAAPQQFTITNAGNQPMTWSGVLASSNSVTGTWYSISPAGATLDPGASSTITVTPVAMPQYPSNPTNTAQFNDTVVITTDITGDSPHNVALSETPLGDILAFDTTKFTFGPTPINTPETAPFNIVNNANTGSPQANVTITSNAPGNAYYTVVPTTAGINAGGTSGDINVTFQSANPGTFTGDIAIATSDVLCAPLPADLTPSAQATEAGPACNSVGGGPCALNFGNVNCGSQANAAQLTMTNTGTQTYTVTGTSLSANTYYTVTMTPSSGIVDPGGQVTLTVTPNAIPTSVSSVPDTATYSDVLTITTNANVPNPNFSAPLTMGAQGVIISNTLATTNWSFGTVNYGSTGFFNVAIRNAGNQQVSVGLSGLNYPTIFGLQSNPAIDTSPPDQMTITGIFTPPSGSGSWADTGTLAVTPVPGAVFCQALPSSWNSPTITMTGTASNNSLVTVSPTSLPFPSATCGNAVPAALSVSVKNNGSNSQGYTATLGSGTYYGITAGASGTIAGGGTGTVSVQPTVNLTAGAGASTGSAPYDDILIVTVASTQYYVPITMTVNGVVLSVKNPLGYTFSGQQCGVNTSFSVDYYAELENYYGTEYRYAYSPTLQNTGNISGNVTVAFTGCNTDYFSASPTSSSINANSSQNFTLDATANIPANSGNWQSGTMTFSSPNMCNPPLSVPIAGYHYVYP